MDKVFESKATLGNMVIFGISKQGHMGVGGLILRKIRKNEGTNFSVYNYTSHEHLEWFEFSISTACFYLTRTSSPKQFGRAFSAK